MPNGDGSYSLTGHKWSPRRRCATSFLGVGQAPGGLSFFFLASNPVRRQPQSDVLQRLKDKLGTRQRLQRGRVRRATAWLVGEEGDGVQTIIEMVNLTRLDCTLGSRRPACHGLTRAIHHAQHRKAFGEYLIDHR